MKVNVGDVIVTMWDDTVEFLKGKVESIYRGHRGPVYCVRIEGELEKVYPVQILRKLRRA